MRRHEKTLEDTIQKDIRRSRRHEKTRERNAKGMEVQMARYLPASLCYRNNPLKKSSPSLHEYRGMLHHDIGGFDPLLWPSPTLTPTTGERRQHAHHDNNHRHQVKSPIMGSFLA